MRRCRALPGTASSRSTRTRASGWAWTPTASSPSSTSCGRAARRPGRSGLAEALDLLGTQLVREPARRQFDVGVGERLVAGDVAREAAALRDAHREQVLRRGDGRVLERPVGVVAADPVEGVARAEVALGERD